MDGMSELNEFFTSEGESALRLPGLKSWSAQVSARPEWEKFPECQQ